MKKLITYSSALLLALGSTAYAQGGGGGAGGGLRCRNGRHVRWLDERPGQHKRHRLHGRTFRYKRFRRAELRECGKPDWKQQR